MMKPIDQGILRPATGFDPQDTLPKLGEGRDLDKDSEAFESMMKDDEKRSSDKDETEDTKKKKDQAGPSGDGILQSLQAKPRFDVSDQVDSAESSSSISSVAQEIADKILVSDVSPSGNGEVRIMLKDSTLSGTEIRIAKNGGQINVDLLTTSNDSHRVLMDHQGDLQNILREKVNETVNVAVKFNNTAGEHNDGRSREQRNLYEELLEKN